MRQVVRAGGEVFDVRGEPQGGRGARSRAGPAALADQLTVAFEGVYAAVQASRADWPARRARALAELLIGAHQA
ncbi:hypothetical protein [Streptomyces litchfieldiae]|uniref:TetR family transcriptional regulator n=1 Tax=Streptomyces litchfieldiae TaxID=3075543 RepID=A0ABU2MML9_9ACTN|nr:hypothetical protein [Streptomyces sp. DSM 44938]MDT0342844.1 hypothetical protein [Streptomyces sp. DSM 44938]